MSEPATTPEAPANPAEAIPSAPTVSTDNFVDSIEKAFSGALTPTPTPEPEPKKPDAPEKPEPKSTESPEPSKDPTPNTAEAPEKTDPKDPLSELENIEESTKDWTPEAARRFKEIKSENKNFQKRISELEEAAKKFDQKNLEADALVDHPEFKTLQEKLQAAENKLLVTRLEESDAYQSAIAEPLNKLAEEATKIAEKVKVDPDSLIEAISIKDTTLQKERISELMADADEMDRFDVYEIVKALKPLAAKREELVANASEALKEAEALSETKKREALREQVAARRDAAQKVVETVKTRIPYLESLDGVDLSAIQAEAAESDPTTLDPVTGTYRAVSAALLPKLVAHSFSLQKEIEALTDKLAEYDNAAPKTSGGSGSVSTSAPASNEGGFLEAMTKALGGR